MITFDGDRSKKRKWFAEKQLGIIHDLDVPAKSLKWEGFTFSVWQQGDLDGGRVMAPMGLVIARSTSEAIGTDILVAESWEAGLSSARKAHAMHWNGTSYKTFNRPEEAPAGVIAVPLKTRNTLSPAGVTQVGMYRDHNPKPFVHPLGEGFFFTTTGSAFVDLNSNGIPDTNKIIVDSSLLAYLENGDRIIGRVGCSENVTDGSSHPFKTVFNLGGSGVRQAITTVAAYSTVGGVPYAACFYVVDFTGAAIGFITCDDMWSDVPSGLKTIMISGANGESSPVGYYAFTHGDQEIFLTGTRLTDLFGVPGSSASSWMSSNAAPEWHCFYSMLYDSTLYTVTSDQFAPLLEIKASASLSEAEVRTVFRQFFGWPNNNFTNAYDSAMFHGHDGNVYSWTRRYGSVKFTPTGLFDGGVSVPLPVATDGVRPEITHAGDGVYVCACNRVIDRTIEAVYVGSPFDSWTLLDDLTGFTLLHIRPASATYDAEAETYSVVLLGVARREATEELEEAHFACIYRDGWLVTQQLPPSQEDGVPIDSDGREEFSIAMFGDGPIVGMLQSYPSRPHALPQMPVSTNYSDYAIGLP